MTDYNQGSADSPVALRVDRSTFLPNPMGPYDVVNSRFADSLQIANDMLDLLVGSDGQSGYLGILNGLIDQSAPVTEIDIDPVDTSFDVSTVKPPPEFRGELGDFPDFNAADPEIRTIPTVDISDITRPDKPADINVTVNWSEIPISGDVYQYLLARILKDINVGATGLSDEVQTALQTSSIFRQRIANDKAYQQVLNDIGARGARAASGALVGAITEITTEMLAQESESSRNIYTTNADLAQKNSQFIIETALRLETLLRDTRDKESDRSLEYEKAVADIAIRLYSEKVRMYIAIAEADKVYMEVQIMNIQAIVAYNQGLIDQYKALADVFNTKVTAIRSKNSGITDVYGAEIQGYDAESQAISRTDQNKMENIKTKIAAADLLLREQIGNANNTLTGYSTEANLKEKISNDMASLATQSVVGSLTSVHANASLGYSASESASENWSHSDNLSESHTYEHDPED